MAQIDNEGVEQLKIIKGALKVMYDTLPTEAFNSVKSEFNVVAEIIDQATHEWGRV